MVRKWFAISTIALVLLTATACQNNEKFTDGTYTGEGEGKNGPLKVEVVVEKGLIKAITVLDHSETPGLSDPILEKIPAAIIEAQSLEVEVVAGATWTSEAVINAVGDALDIQK